MGEINFVVLSSRGWTFFKEHGRWMGVTRLESGGRFIYTLHPEWEGKILVLLEVSLIVNSLLNGRQTT